MPLMALTNGTKLGPHEIVAPLGSGGMGEVYRARDTRLDRTVAIKILPAQLSADPARKQRFEREAKTISWRSVQLRRVPRIRGSRRHDRAASPVCAFRPK